MARKSPLTEKQWEQIEKRFMMGESASKLGREFGVAESSIRTRFSANAKKVKTVANQLATAELNFDALNINAKIHARFLADELKAMSTQLASAGKLGAMTANKLARIANIQADKIDELNPLNKDGKSALMSISALTKVANDASVIGIGILKANKTVVDDINKEQDEPPKPTQIVFNTINARSKCATN